MNIDFIKCSADDFIEENQEMLDDLDSNDSISSSEKRDENEEKVKEIINVRTQQLDKNINSSNFIVS